MVRAAAHEMRALYGPLCRAHEAAHEFSQAGRAAAQEMWCTVAALICAMTKSTLPMRCPTRFCGPARAAAHHVFCVLSTTITTSTSALPMRGNQRTFTGRDTGRPACSRRRAVYSVFRSKNSNNNRRGKQMNSILAICILNEN